MHACTIAARNYLPFVQVVARSFLAAHPNHRFSVLVVDGTKDDPELQGQPFDVVLPEQLDLDRTAFHQMAMAYDVTELSTALKPWMLRHVLDSGDDVAVYLDPDIRVYAGFEELDALVREHGIVLTPHTLSPIPRDGLKPTEADILGSGVYNLGFIAVAQQARGFLLWWSERLRRDSISDPSNMLFTDQRWIDFVPSYFRPKILEDYGFNVAYWNLFERPLSRSDGGYLANGVPLRFFHFSGFRPDKPWILSKYVADNPRSTISADAVLRELCAGYGSAVTEAGFEHESAVPYGWNHLADGSRVSPRQRRYFRDALIAWDAGEGPEPPDPFGPAGAETFRDWLRSPAGSDATCLVTREQHAVWLARGDLRAAFPHPFGRDQGAFLEWVRDSGVTQENLSVPTVLPAVSTGGASLEPSLTEGVNIAGYFRAELGVGKLGRLIVDAAKEADLPFRTVTNDLTLSRQDHPFEDQDLDLPHFPFNVIAVNADALPAFAQEVGPAFFDDSYTVGLWAWEIEDFPASMHGAFDHVDEVWAISDFTREAIAAHTTKPVYTFPMPVQPIEPPKVSRVDLDLPAGFLFLFTFDYLSVAERKNPFGVVDAFTRAFAPGEGPRLVLKGINGQLRAEDRERLRFHVGDRPDILLLEDYLDAEETLGLLNACDVFVSLHRCEGYGLAIAEAMALGKPVITTGYSGSADFTNPDVAYVVPYRLVGIPRGAEPYPTSSRWAEPDLDAAAAFMRKAFDDPESAQAMGRRGQRYILGEFPIARSAEFLRARVSEALRDRRTWGAARGGSPAGGDHVLSGLVQRAQHELHQPAAESSRVLGRSFRKVLNRVLHHREARLQSQLDSLYELGSALAHLSQHQERAVSQLDRDTRRNLESLRRTTAATLAKQSEERASERRAREVETAASAERDRQLTHLQDAARKLDDALAVTSLHQAQFRDVAARLDELNTRIDGLDLELAAEPFRTSDALHGSVDHLGRRTLGYDTSAYSPSDYAAFEDVFRGSSGFVRDRLTPYAALLKQHAPVLDVGCGRGEFLQVLRAQGIEGRGVDLDASMVKRALSEELVVEEGDALHRLRETPRASLGAVTSFQVVEHMPPADVGALFAAAFDALRPGGVLIAETVNPHSPAALKAFWLDVTHVRPLYPEALLFLAQESGFTSANITFVHGRDDLRANLRTCGEYALVAYKPR